ncbi:hypothetical protein HZA56_19025 [Candidatus Poribacteria bacterium]|nr:hypothetical protein [Candidatus Poribacteria bacterium]
MDGVDDMDEMDEVDEVDEVEGRRSSLEGAGCAVRISTRRRQVISH